MRRKLDAREVSRDFATIAHRLLGTEASNPAEAARVAYLVATLVQYLQDHYELDWTGEDNPSDEP